MLDYWIDLMFLGLGCMVFYLCGLELIFFCYVVIVFLFAGLTLWFVLVC